MSLHNLATVFGPTLLRPSESESLKGQHIMSATDIWSHDVMGQVWGFFPAYKANILSSLFGSHCVCVYVFYIHSSPTSPSDPNGRPSLLYLDFRPCAASLDRFPARQRVFQQSKQKSVNIRNRSACRRSCLHITRNKIHYEEDSKHVFPFNLII